MKPLKSILVSIALAASSSMPALAQNAPFSDSQIDVLSSLVAAYCIYQEGHYMTPQGALQDTIAKLENEGYSRSYIRLQLKRNRDVVFDLAAKQCGYTRSANSRPSGNGHMYIKAH